MCPTIVLSFAQQIEDACMLLHGECFVSDGGRAIAVKFDQQTVLKLFNSLLVCCPLQKKYFWSHGSAEMASAERGRQVLKPPVYVDVRLIPHRQDDGCQPNLIYCQVYFSPAVSTQQMSEGLYPVPPPPRCVAVRFKRIQLMQALSRYDCLHLHVDKKLNS